MFELTGFQRDLLYTIAGLDKPSGQRVLEEISEDVGEVNHGRLYPNLDALVEEGYVERGEQDRRTNYYEITEAGTRVLRERREWENGKVPFFS
jgi:DNA-binding PadR family transcriptional regulator